MKKILSVFLILFVFTSLTIFSFVLARNAGESDQKQGDSQGQSQQGMSQTDEDEQIQEENGQKGLQTQDQTQEQTQTQTQVQEQEEGSIDTVNGQQLRARNFNELQSMIKEKRDEMIGEIKSMRGNLQKAYQNQNEVRIAVHALLSMEDLIGGIGNKVSEVAKGFNNSIQQTIKAEETIRNRNRILRFFAGGDQKTAEELQNLVDQNRIRIQKLKELKGDCDCEEEARTLIQEQIQSMEQGQDRLQEMIQDEKATRGIWGWFKGLFGK